LIFTTFLRTMTFSPMDVTSGSGQNDLENARLIRHHDPRKSELISWSPLTLSVRFLMKHLVYLWSRFVRHFFYWILPTLVIFLVLSLAIELVLVQPSRFVLQMPEASCYIFNITRAPVDLEDSGSFADFMLVGYNTSAVNLSLPLKFEHYATVSECVGTQNETCRVAYAVSLPVQCLSPFE